jgi:hypothetical protein
MMQAVVANVAPVNVVQLQEQPQPPPERPDSVDNIGIHALAMNASLSPAP